MAKPTPSEPVPAPGKGKRGTRGHIAYLLHQADAAVRSALDTALAEVGLTTPQFLVLNLLNAYPGASGAELAVMAHRTPQTVNLIVRKLERDKLIWRREHESHGRVLRLELTSVGQQRLRQGKRLADGIERRLLALLDRTSAPKVRRWLAETAGALLRS
jgi:DNA-binding MarR family transcriptional regulator